MKERIQKILAARGVASRRQAENMILAGRVTCNGAIVQLGDTADCEYDNILLDGKPIPTRRPFLYIMLNKPRGYVTTMSDEKNRKTVIELVDCAERVYPIGRLDMDSEGLLLLTNDGEFANAMMHPSHEIEKTYRVSVTGYTEKGLISLRKPIVIDGYRIQPPKVNLVQENEQNAELLITIHEGRNRQVRRMCAAAGMRVTRLVRIQEGSLELGGLKSGKWRYLSEAEVNALKNES